MDLDKKKARVGRASWLYNAYVDQDLFGVPVTLTFQGRDQVKTGCGAFISILVRLLIIVYVTFMAVKMTVHELDYYRTTDHLLNFSDLGPVSLSELGFTLAIGSR